MSGYIRSSADDWLEERMAARWTPEAPARAVWVRLDIAWHVDRLKLPSVREAADFWGWSKDKAAKEIRSCVAEQLAWEQRADRKAAIEAMLAAWSAKGGAKGPRATDSRQRSERQHDTNATGDHGSTPETPETARQMPDADATDSRQIRDSRASSSGQLQPQPHEQTPAPAAPPENQPPTTQTTDGRPVPSDLGGFGLRPSDVGIIVEYCDTPADLLMRSQAEISRWRGLGDPGAERVARACQRAGFPLGCVTRPAPMAASPAAADRARNADSPGLRAWEALVTLTERGGHHSRNPPERFDADPGRDRAFRLALREAGGWPAFCNRDRFTTPAMRDAFVAAWRLPDTERAAS